MTELDRQLDKVEAILSEIEAMPRELRELLIGDEDIVEAYETARRMMRRSGQR